MPSFHDITGLLHSWLTGDVLIHVLLLFGVIGVPWLFVTLGLRASSTAALFLPHDEVRAPRLLIKQFKSFK